MARSISPFAALRSRNFALFWAGSFVSQTGTQMQIVAVAWQIYQLTHSATYLGYIGLATFIPIVFFSLLGGVSADKFNRKTILLLSQVASAVVAIILAVATQTHHASPLLIYASLALIAIANSFGMPARQSVIPALVSKEYFMNAVSLNTLQRQTAVIVGPAFAGIMIAAYGVQSVYYYNALTFVILIIALLPIKIPKITESPKVDFSIKSVWEGISFVKNSPILLSTMLLDFLANFFASASILMPIFATDILKVGASGLGLLYSAPAIGGVVAGLILSSIHNLKHQGKVILVAITVYGLATIGFALSKNLFLSLFFLALTEAGDMVSTIVRNTLRQTLTPDYVRGRMVSVNMIFVQGGPQLGDAEAGFLAAIVGAPLSVLAGGVGTIIITAWIAAKVKQLREYNGNQLAV